jgi:hypothetical protein
MERCSAVADELARHRIDAHDVAGREHLPPEQSGLMQRAVREPVDREHRRHPAGWGIDNRSRVRAALDERVRRLAAFDAAWASRRVTCAHRERHRIR